jgi:hypothetical protein
VTASLLLSAQSRILFPYEQQQLTREYDASLPDEYAQLFAFGDQFIETEAVNTTDKRCRYDPTDKKGPSEKAWNKLRNKLSSPCTLISTVSQATVCYEAARNDAQCQQLTQN